jgi:hypothetical protein
MSSYLGVLRSNLNILPISPDLETGLEISLKTRGHFYTASPRPEFSEEVPVPESVAKLFRTIMTDHKKVEAGECHYPTYLGGAWCDEPVSETSVLKCYITGPPPPKALPFWEYVEYRNLQDMRDGVAPKSLEELRAIYNDESYWGWLH